MSTQRNPGRVQPEDLFKLHILQDGQFSPDGTKVAYEVSFTDGDDECAAIHLLALDSGTSRQLTSGTKQNGSPRWSPDGKQIAFISTRGDKPQIYLIPTDGGEAQAITRLERGVGNGIAWSPDGRQIAFSAPPQRPALDLSKPYRIDRFYYRLDGLGNLDNGVQEIYVMTADGADLRAVTADNCINSAPRWSPDGGSLLYLSALQTGKHPYIPALKVVDLTGKQRDLTGDWGYANAAVWTPDGKQIVFSGNPHGQPIGTQDQLWVIDANGGTTECRTVGFDFKVSGGLQSDMMARNLLRSPRILVSEDSANAIVQVQVGGTVQLYRVALRGPQAWEAILSGERTCIALDLAPRQILFASSTPHDPIQLCVADAEGGNEQALTHLNHSVLAGWDRPRVEPLHFASSDGERIEGWIMLPTTGKAPFPTILYIHGGPHSGFGHIFSFDFRLLCSAGYAVLFINQRASTGYGDKFATQIKGDWGNLDYQDLMAGVDFAIAKGWVDGERMGVCGLSGGGNLSCWIVGQTERFKAAVPENPVTNWNSFYGVSDIGPWFAVEQLGGKPHEIPEIYARCSPITYAHRCKTPTLLIQGEADWRCPAEQSEQFYTVLRANGCIAEMLRLPNSPHAGSIAGDPVLRRAQNEALLDWMDRFVLGK